ncbi:MAG TPA: DNA primase, partial [Bauldia sp.]|nr:DNA primase [Bauldia sp.]
MPDRDPEAEERERKRSTLHEVMDLAARFFEESLQGRAGAAARGYLARRELGADLQRRFRIGYAPPDRSALKSWLAAKDVTQEQMIAAGLLIAGDDIPVSYDRFRD